MHGLEAEADPELDFGRPSDSFYCLFDMGSFSSSLFAIGIVTV